MTEKTTSFTKAPRIWVSTTSPQKEEILRVRAQVEHIMESGLRINPDTGKIRKKNIVNKFEAHFQPDGTNERQKIFTFEPNISIARNPYIEFTFIAKNSGLIIFDWQDDNGNTINASKTIKIKNAEQTTE